MAKRKRHVTLDNWSQEIAAVTVSLLALVAIFVLLGYFDGKPLFTWHNITLNTVVSIVATLSRFMTAYAMCSCLGQFKWIWFSRAGRPLSDFKLMNDASRGPWGGSRFLWNNGSFSIVAIGCWVAILNIFIDPFMQQIISYREAVEYTPNENAYIPFASRWSAAQEYITVLGHLSESVTGFSDLLTGPRPHLNFTTQAAIISGISTDSAQISQRLGLDCETGTCKWEGYKSLAVCSTCNDVADTLISGSIPDIAVQSAWFGDANGVYDSNITWFKLPGNGLNINNPDNYIFSNGSTERITMSGQANSDPKFTITFQNSSTFLFSMSLIWADFDKDYKYSDWPKTSLNALECGLYLCVKEFNSTLVNGTLEETSEEIGSTRSLGSWQPIDAAPENSLVIEQLYDRKINAKNFKRTDLQIHSPNKPGSLTSFDYANVSQTAVQALVYYLYKTFDDGSMWSSVPDMDTGTIHQDQLMPNVTGLVRLVPGTHQYQFLPEIMDVFWNARDIREVFLNLATSLTNNIRMSADGSTNVSGFVGRYKTLIRVRWPWVVLPCATALLGAAFLVCTILATSRTNLPIWKDNALATLFHGIDPDVQKGLPNYSLEREMEAEAESITVKLIMTEKGLMLGDVPVGLADDQAALLRSSISEYAPVASTSEDIEMHTPSHPSKALISQT